MYYSEELKSQVLGDIENGGNYNDSIQLLKTKHGCAISDCLKILNKIYLDGINDLRNQEDKVVKTELESFLHDNEEYLEIIIPIENWESKKILFTTNSSIKGKVLFKMERIEFKLKHIFFWYSQDGDRSYFSQHWFDSPLEKINYGEFNFPVDNNGTILYNRLPNLCKNLLKSSVEFTSRIEKIKTQIKNLKKAKSNLLEEERLLKLNYKQNSIYSDLDKDGNGEVDLVDGESFNRLLTKNQVIIMEIDKSYIQKFVLISMYLKTKKRNTQTIFDSVKDATNDDDLDVLVNLLKNQIHTYEVLVFHSINMITSLVDKNLITFYEIYECFDQLGVFNSNWENEVSKKLSDIGDGLKDLMYQIYRMENSIVNSIEELSYVTQDSFRDLTYSVERQLGDINSSIKFNNLLTGIQTYQMYKINQNTKWLK